MEEALQSTKEAGNILNIPEHASWPEGFDISYI